MYEVVSFTEDNTTAILRVTNLIDNGQGTEITRSKANFHDHPPCSIETWNLHRLNTDRTIT